MGRYVVGVSGASGAVYGRRLVEALASAGHELHLVVSQAAAKVVAVELVEKVDPNDPDSVRKTFGAPDAHVHGPNQMDAAIASGSFKTDGMVIIPCSMGTIGRIASGVSTGLIDRAADVHLKERRRLVVVPRETPYSLIHLQNMLTLTQAGAIVLPASPGFYGHQQTVDQLVDFVVCRALDHLGVSNELAPRYGELAPEEAE